MSFPFRSPSPSCVSHIFWRNLAVQVHLRTTFFHDTEHIGEEIITNLQRTHREYSRYSHQIKLLSTSKVINLGCVCPLNSAQPQGNSIQRLVHWPRYFWYHLRLSYTGQFLFSNFLSGNRHKRLELAVNRKYVCFFYDFHMIFQGNAERKLASQHCFHWWSFKQL